MDDEKVELTEAEQQYIDELILFGRAGIKACVFHKIDGDVCMGDVNTIGKDPELDDQGKVVKMGLRMNLCEAHFDASGEGWRIYSDDE